jgi:hypothetical protein
MKIWTSNFSRAGREPSAVSIARSEPRGWQGKSYKALAPAWDWVKKIKSGEWTDADYMEAYYGLLVKLDPAKVLEDLGDCAILLCWCNAPKDFCHRTMVAEWFKVELGLEVPER